MTLSVGIVGGGINGMATAWTLTKAGHAFTVCEPKHRHAYHHPSIFKFLIVLGGKRITSMSLAWKVATK